MMALSVSFLLRAAIEFEETRIERSDMCKELLKSTARRRHSQRFYSCSSCKGRLGSASGRVYCSSKIFERLDEAVKGH